MSGNWNGEILDMDEGKRKDKRSIELFAFETKNPLLLFTNDDTVYSIKTYTLAYER
jgi:hypothetical protein